MSSPYGRPRTSRSTRTTASERSRRSNAENEHYSSPNASDQALMEDAPSVSDPVLTLTSSYSPFQEEAQTQNPELTVVNAEIVEDSQPNRVPNITDDPVLEVLAFL